MKVILEIHRETKISQIFIEQGAGTQRTPSMGLKKIHLEHLTRNPREL